MLIAGAVEPLEEVRREDLHVAGEHHQVDVGEQLEEPCLGGGLVLGRDVVEGQPVRCDPLGELGVVRDDHRRTAFELALLEAPEEVEEAVVVAGDEDRDALLGIRASEAPVHLEALGELAELDRWVLLELGLDAKEEAIAGGMLLCIDDVCAALEEEIRDCCNDPGAVRTGNEEPNTFFHGQMSSLRATLQL